jgi:response regulator RpfG family c-di-GMP phosphodiesterase
MAQKNAHSARILIVDDEQGPRESLRMILSPLHEVLVATDGASALETLRTESVDLVTVDLNMPGMRGDELMRTIREELPHVEVIVITGYGTVETAVEGIRYGVCDYLSKPFDVVQVGAAVNRALARSASRRNLVSFLEGVGQILGKDRDSSDLLGKIDGNRHLQDRLRALLQEPALDPDAVRAGASDARTVEFLEVLAETMESRDTFMRGHARQVAFFSGLLADRLCLRAEDREHVRLSSFLHDIGKVGVPIDVMASRYSLDAEQRRAVEEHSRIGERLVKPLGFSGAIASAIRHHHERWDGGGYPDGLSGEEIPMASRIVAVADSFDAMTNDRPHRPAMTQDAALAELRKHAGSQFDPTLVMEFAGLVESGGFELAAARHEPAVKVSLESADPSTSRKGGN